ncbi:hypothetical protein GTR02_16575, partial [Kineococcus sp. R8]
RPLPAPSAGPGPAAPQRPRTVDVGAVLSGLVLVAVAAAVTAREVTGTTWDWRWSAAGVLLVAGLCVVVAALVTAVRQHGREPGADDGPTAGRPADPGPPR